MSAMAIIDEIESAEVETNALEAMPNGGQIHIRAKTAGDFALVEIEDTGPGIPLGILDRLFEPFVTAGKRDGLGLGLALARQTVLDHGGDMWTEPAAGARFFIRLPLNRHRDTHTCSFSAGRWLVDGRLDSKEE
jgi:signal transduction histidine kinase